MEIRRKSLTSLLRFGALIALSVPAAFTLAAPNASAQSTPPCVQSSSATPQSAVIRVVDQSGALLPHAAVEVRCGKTVLNAIADDRGEARFQLPPGKYTL